MRIVIVDDDKLIAVSLKTIIEASSEIQVDAVGYDGEMAVDLYERYKPDILLMDIRMENINGIEAAEKILKKEKEAKILFLTTFEDDEYIVKALNIGVKGYILKQHFEGIVAALKAVYNGQSVFGSEIVSKIPTMINSKGYSDKKENNTEKLSEKELEIITLVSEGMSNKEIASSIFLSEGTVRNYISVILEKLSLRDRTQLVIYYFNYIKKN